MNEFNSRLYVAEEIIGRLEDEAGKKMLKKKYKQRRALTNKRKK